MKLVHVTCAVSCIGFLWTTGELFSAAGFPLDPFMLLLVLWYASPGSGWIATGFMVASWDSRFQTTADSLVLIGATVSAIVGEHFLREVISDPTMGIVGLLIPPFQTLFSSPFLLAAVVAGVWRKPNTSRGPSVAAEAATEKPNVS